MTAFDQLSSKELHDRAVELAKQRHDLKFFWRLIEEIPAAEVVAKNLPEAQAEVQHLSSWLYDLIHSGDGALAEALRPIFIEYLKHYG